MKLVSYLSPVSGGSDITISIPTFAKRKQIGCLEKQCKETVKISSKLVRIEQVIGFTKAFKILTLALNRTEANIASDISFVVLQFQTMHYSTI